MKIILSRKGFDSGTGGIPSPILPDGTMLSMPIPSEDTLTFDELRHGELTYREILRQLAPDREYDTCHLDPDIREGVRAEAVPGWKPALGQMHSAEGHLRNNNIGAGDLFIFFGLFCKTEQTEDGTLVFTGPSIQAIYGYLQVEERLTGDDIFPWHPHARPETRSDPNNAIYTASERLVIDGVDTGKPGYGVFQFDENRQLTVPGEWRSTRWKLLPWMNADMKMTFHSQSSIKEDYFQCVKRGQEFVIDGNPLVLEWVKTLF